MLDIRTVRSERKGFRADIFRRYKHEDTATDKVKYTYKQVGSFLLTEGYSAELLEQLQPEEIIQLQNWLAEVRFGESLGAPLDELEKISLRIPPQLAAALTRLYIEAKRLGVEFILHRQVLHSILEQAIALQRQIDEKNGFPCGILENAGIAPTTLATTPDAGENTECATNAETHALFQALLDLPQPIGVTCSALEAAAYRIGKRKKIPPPQVKEWAGAMSHRNPHKHIKKWCYAIAIDVLQQHGVNPIQKMSPGRVAAYWAIQQQTHYSVIEALTTFIREFSVPPEQQAAVTVAIGQIYEKTADYLGTNHHPSSQPIAPS